MDKNQILMKKKLGFFETLQEALKIFVTNPKFIFFIFLTSLPLFSSLLLHEISFQHTSTQVSKILNDSLFSDPLVCERMLGSPVFFVNCHRQISPFYVIDKLKEAISPDFALWVLLSSSIVNFLDLINTIFTVYSAAAIYGGKTQMSIKEMFLEPIKKVGLKGPLTTFLFALLLASLTLLGLLSIFLNFSMIPGFLLKILICGLFFLAWLKTYVEWSAIWKMGIVISVLEKKDGYIGLGVSAYMSRGSRKKGLCLMLVFYVWSTSLRLSCLYIGWNKGGCGNLGTVVNAGLNCVGNVVMWVVLVVYFYDCKKMILEKKIDMERGKVAEAVES